MPLGNDLVIDQNTVMESGREHRIIDLIEKFPGLNIGTVSPTLNEISLPVLIHHFGFSVCKKLGWCRGRSTVCFIMSVVLPLTRWYERPVRIDRQHKVQSKGVT